LATIMALSNLEIAPSTYASQEISRRRSGADAP
jgi:hypothetical protein